MPMPYFGESPDWSFEKEQATKGYPVDRVGAEYPVLSSELLSFETTTGTGEMTLLLWGKHPKQIIMILIIIHLVSK